MKGFYLFLAIVLLNGCADKPGSGILGEKRMTNVMWDLLQADEFATTFVAKDSSLDLKKERFRLYQDVYRINGLDEKEFSDSYKYYTGRPDLMKRIFDSLTTKGERERKLIYQPVDTPSVKKLSIVDSLNKDSLKSAFLYKDSIRIDSMRKVMKNRNAIDSIFKRTKPLKKVKPKRISKQ